MKRRFRQSYLLPTSVPTAKEVFSHAPGYEGLYLISNAGRVFSFYTGKILKANPDSHGRLCCGLCDPNGRATVPVHQLVALAFVPNPSALPEVDHIDGDFQNNLSTNLEWVTGDENRRRFQKMEAEKGGFYGQVDDNDALTIFTLRAFGASRRGLAQTFGRNESTISKITTGQHRATSFLIKD